MLFDWDTALLGQVDSYDINRAYGRSENTDWYEFELKSRPGYRRLTLDTMCGAEGYHQSFNHIIEERKERAIQFPYHQSIVGTNLVKFKNVAKPE